MSNGEHQEDQPDIDSPTLEDDILELLDEEDASLLEDDEKADEADDDDDPENREAAKDKGEKEDGNDQRLYLIPNANQQITLNPREIAREQRRAIREGKFDNTLALQEEIARTRPKTREDCMNGERPCIYFSCRHNLMIDVDPENGSLKINFPDVLIDDFDFSRIPATCALDVAEKGGLTLEDVGDIMNLTRERIRQLETEALQRFDDASYGLHEDDCFTESDTATTTQTQPKQDTTPVVTKSTKTPPTKGQQDTDFDFSLDGTFDI